jgi:hypothetical protein
VDAHKIFQIIAPRSHQPQASCQSASNSKFTSAARQDGEHRVAVGLEGVEHQVEQVLPGAKRQVLCQGREVLEEGAPAGQAPANGLVALIQALTAMP